MKWHQAKVHGINQVWHKCDFCMYKALHMGNLRQHMERHNSKKFKVRKPREVSEDSSDSIGSEDLYICREVEERGGDHNNYSP